MGDHYIPKFYLKGFADKDKTDSIWAFRNGDPPFLTSIRKIAQEDDFYSREIEQLLANEVEEPANKVIQRIREQQPIFGEDKLTLSKYMMVMWKRVPENKLRVKEKAPKIINPVVARFSRESAELHELHPEKFETIEKRYKEWKK